MAALFTANAETGDVSEWDGVFGDVNPVASNTSPISGTWSFYSVFNGTSQKASMGYWIDAADRDEVWCEWKMRYNPDPWDVAFDSFTTPLMIKNRAYNVSAVWVQFHDTGLAGVVSWEVHGQIDGNADYTFGSSATGITPTVAQTFKLRYVRHATTGGVQFWIDGESVLSVLNQNTAAFYAGMFYMGAYNPGDGDFPAASNQLRWDDVTYDIADPSPPAGGSIFDVRRHVKMIF